MKQYQKNVHFYICCLIVSQVYSQQPPCGVDYKFDTTTKLCTACVAGAISLGGITSCSCKQGASSLYSEPLPGAAVGPVLTTEFTQFDGHTGSEFFAGAALVQTTAGVVIYLAPKDSRYVGMYNTDTKIFSTIAIQGKINTFILNGVQHTSNVGGYSMNNDEKYSGAVYAPNSGKVYMIPHELTLVGVVDTSDNTFSTFISTFGGSKQYNGGVLSEDGNLIYMVPFLSNAIGVIDVNSHAITTINIGGNPGPTRRYQGGVLAGNGKIYFCPHHSPSIGVLDPAAGNTFSVIDISDITIVKNNWNQPYFAEFVLHTDGMIYSIPAASDFIYKLDPYTHIFSVFLDLTEFVPKATRPLLYTYEDKFSEGISVGLDKIYLISGLSPDIGLLTLFPTPKFEIILELSDHFWRYNGGVLLFGKIYLTTGSQAKLDVIDLNLPVLSSCTPCLAGTFSSLPGSDTCTSCLAGTFSSLPGSDNCTTCPSHSSSPLAGLTLNRCLCDAGYTGADSGVCTACASGTTKTTIGSAPCVESSNTAAAGICQKDWNGFCQSCLPGSFSIQDTTVDHCIPCPAGTWNSKNNARGVGSCTLCRPGKFSTMPGMISVDSCQACPEGTFHREFGVTDSSKCQTCSCR